MNKSLLLHALSLRDRILEPHSLPLQGYVFGFTKVGCSKMAFTGKCLSLLALFGIEDVDIDWDEHIMAFDAKCGGRDCTVVISLSDDSLASEHYYFIGVWLRGDKGASIASLRAAMPIDELIQSLQAEDAELQADMIYALSFCDEPQRLDTIESRIGSGTYSELLYGGSLMLTSDEAGEGGTHSNIVIAPVSHAPNFSKYEVKHALYSIRNLMALTSQAKHCYARIWADDSIASLYQEMMVLLNQLGPGRIESEQWEKIVCGIGDATLKAHELSASLNSHESDMEALKTLFNSILIELQVRGENGHSGLIPRWRMPFGHVLALLHERTAMLSRCEKQAEVAMQLAHSRMLASQQQLLEKILMQ